MSENANKGHDLGSRRAWRIDRMMPREFWDHADVGLRFDIPIRRRGVLVRK